ncbi:MAG TPA: GTP 3',8-cyclase MoaA [Candidatus Dormibacteraeota bacterium]
MTVTAPTSMPADMLGRALRDVRMSMTDRCNFRCPYCMPRSHFGPGHRFVPGAAALSAGELVRLAAVFMSLGATKIRLTGGEPLLRRDLGRIVAGMAALPVPDLALTTNGALLARRAGELRSCGLHRVTVSLDSLHPDVFAAMSDVGVPVSDVVAGIRAARDAGLAPIKLNCVVRRGVNDSGIAELVEFACAEQLQVRFIEYMDVGTTNGWRREDVVTGREILERLAVSHHIEELPPEPGAVARRYRLAGGAEIGLITSVSRPFCGDCSRARLSVDGRLFTCLFAADGLDLRAPLRAGASDEELRDIVRGRWAARDDRYSELRAAQTDAPQRVEMSYIGG